MIQKLFSPFDKIYNKHLISLSIFFITCLFLLGLATSAFSATIKTASENLKSRDHFSKFLENLNLKYDWFHPDLIIPKDQNPIPSRHYGNLKSKLQNPRDLPSLFVDDLDKNSIIKAINNQLKVMKNRDRDLPVKLGTFRITYGRLVHTLTAFRDLIKQDLTQEEFDRRLREEFIFYQAGSGRKNQALFTGYYAPVIKASRHKTRNYRYPVYYQPENLLKVTLVDHNPYGLNKNRRYHSFYKARNLTREEIDGQLALAHRNLEIAWLKDELDRYFLHIQGSGILSYQNGTTESILYMGSNGYPYYSVGKRMIRDGVLHPHQGSMQGIKQYFRDHPEDIPKYLYKNKRYIFFKLANQRPRGSGRGELVAHRSIASDKRWFPAGGLAFISGKKPVLDDDNKIAGWKPFSRFVVDQDTGSAIKGHGRADLYFGIGDRAGAAAGRFMMRGKAFYLLKK